jgi:hypothetical protein
MEQDRQQREAADRERIRREDLERERERETAEIAQQRELQNAIDLSKSLDRERGIKILRENLKEEPGDGPDVSNIRLQLPTGGKLSRKFWKHDTIQVIHNHFSHEFVLG